MDKLANISQFESLMNNASCTIQNVHEAPEEDPDSIIAEVFKRYKDSVQRYNNLNMLFSKVQDLGISGWNASLPIVERISSELNGIEEDIATMKERLLDVHKETANWTRGKDSGLRGNNLDDYLAGDRKNWWEDVKPENLDNIKELIAYANKGR